MSTKTADGYEKQEFIAWLQAAKHQQLDVAQANAVYVGTWLRSGKSGEDFVQSYDNAYTYNNYLFAINHWREFTGRPKLPLKQKQCIPKNLIIAPKVEEMRRVIREIKDKHVKCYISLCATTGLRPERLLKAGWHEIDFENAWVMINERHYKKTYRPNCLHKDVAKLLQELKPVATGERIFDFTYRKVANELKSANTSIRPSNCRDFFFNFSRKCGADRDQIEWLMGHSLPGVRAHYLADELKQEYAKFEEAFRLAEVSA